MAALEAAIRKKEDMGDRGSRKPFDTISSYLQEERRENERKEIIAEEEEVARQALHAWILGSLWWRNLFNPFDVLFYLFIYSSFLVH